MKIDLPSTYLQQEIRDVRIDDSSLILYFAGGRLLRFSDQYQQCCETRYMEIQTDDLKYYRGASLLSAEVTDAPDPTDDSHNEVNEAQFLLRIETSKGVIVAVNYNSHNGYYGGFNVEVRES